MNEKGGAAHSSPGQQNQYKRTKDFLRLKGSHHTIAVQGLINVSRRWPTHAHVAGDGLEAQFSTGLRLRHILEFRHGADPIRRPSSPLSLLGAMGQCPFAVDRRSVAVNHLPRGAMATTPDSHATCCHVHDQAVGGQDFRWGSRSVHGIEDHAAFLQKPGAPRF